MNSHKFSAIAALILASWAAGPAHAAVIPHDTRPVFGQPTAGEPLELAAPTPAVQQPTLAPGPGPRVRSAPALEPARVGGGGGGGSTFFNEFINSTLGPLGKSELASSIQSISANLKPYLESQGAYNAPSSSSARELARLNGEKVVLAQEFSYAGVLTPVTPDVRTETVEQRTRSIDTTMVERGNSSQANPVMQGMIGYFSRVLKNLANLLGD